MKSLAIFLLLPALGITSAIAADSPASVAELFATPENLRIVRSADSVDACILRHIEATPRADGSIDRSSERYEETSFVPVPAPAATALRDLLLNRKSYDWKAGNGGRRPRFYLRLRFHRGDELINIDFCFMCHVLNLTHGGQDVGHANFNPSADLFLQALLTVFPGDEALKQVAREAGVPL